MVLINKNGTKLGEMSIPSKIDNKLSNPSLISVSDVAMVGFSMGDDFNMITMQSEN